MRIVLAALVRGYENKHEYRNLIKRNLYLKKNITSKVSQDIDLLLFHEGNIPQDHQDYIIKKSKQEYFFVDISKDFSFDEELLDKIPDLERFSIGYRLMCRFNFYHIWQYLNSYDYLIRVDEDVLIKKFDKRFFDNIDNNFIFGTAEMSNEGHVYTNNTLPTFLREVFNSTEIAFYNHKFPYTNFYVSKLDFWRKQNIQNNLQQISDNPQQIISRWGDLPIIGSILNFENINIEIIKGIEYSHLSHKSKFKISKKIKS